MNFIILISQLIPMIQAVEVLMPASAGSDKLKVLITMVEAVVGSVQAELPAIQGIVKTLVDGFNAIGKFTKKTA